ncbi:glycosyltransferase family 2 protein [Desemzia sp. FAM 23989]|uniref:glycosyltransferase family 2 protein n=1 Tax=Desemzia sp. FAM 23989 TaxID=3259523 RepID=UPI00388708E6
MFTPTYNRQKQLSRLYVSLLKQSNYNFIWLIVDDGSIDQTKDIVEQWISSKPPFEIKYVYKENGGKHSAYNKALEIMNSEWHVTVDSDDWLKEEAISTMYEKKNAFSEKDKYVGIVFPRLNSKDSNLKVKEWIPDEVDSINIADIKFKYHLNIETCILIKNSNLKEFRFPIFSGEKHMSEEPLYNYLAKFGKFYPVPDYIYVFEYLQDGWTNNLFEIWKKNTKSTLYVLSIRYDYISENYQGILKIKELFKAKLNINAIKQIQNDPIKDYDIIDFFMSPLSLLWRKFRFKE